MPCAAAGAPDTRALEPWPRGQRDVLTAPHLWPFPKGSHPPVMAGLPIRPGLLVIGNEIPQRFGRRLGHSSQDLGLHSFAQHPVQKVIGKAVDELAA